MSYHERVLPVMRSTRDMIVASWGLAKPVNQKTDSPWSVVTQLDLDVERLTREALESAYPAIAFVGEEDGGDRTREQFWLMDPIDGTAHYVRGMPFCTSMLALIDKGEVVFGAVYDFLKDELYWAEKGLGAYCNDARLSVSTRPLKDAFVSFETNISKEENVVLRTRLRNKTDLIATYNAGWEFAMVASGKVEARICLEPYGADYDFAPGTLLVSEAGGVVANIGSRTFDYRNLDFIASNKVIFEELTEGRDALFPLP